MNIFLFSFSFSHLFLFIFIKKDGTTPLFIAAQKGNKQIVQILLNGGANVDVAEPVLFFFNFYFDDFKKIDIISISFFKRNLNVKDGATPLFIAAANGDEQIVELLFEKGKANVDCQRKVHFLI